MIWNNCQVDEADFKETLKNFAPDVLAKGGDSCDMQPGGGWNESCITRICEMSKCLH